MRKQLVLIGGGHAHMKTLAGLFSFMEKDCRVTVIDASEQHYYAAMGPGMLSRMYPPDHIRLATRNVVERQGGVFLRDYVLRIDPEEQMVYTQSGDACRYDVLSLNVGSYVPDDIAKGQNDRIFTVKPIERLHLARQTLIKLIREKSITVSVVGGGAAALEIAGNVWRLLSDEKRHDFKVMMFTRRELLERFPRRVADAARRFLQRQAIPLFENCTVKRIRGNHVHLESGELYPSDITFLATGLRPSPIFRASSLPTGEDGGLAVNAFLQSVAYTNIFGGGDCIHFMPKPLEKACVYAKRQSPVLYANLMAAIDGAPLTAFSPRGADLLALNTGDGGGLLLKRGMLVKGRLAFIIKNYIDRRYIKKFPVIE